MSTAQLEEEKSLFQEQLDIVISSLRDDPGNAELVALKDELETGIQMLDESIAELQPRAAAPAPPRQASPPPPPKEKWSRENHPAFRKDAPASASEEKEQESAAAAAPASYHVNDTVLAKWLSGDRGFYPARITSVTGSSAAPMYTVKFKSYDTVETLRARDIRPVVQKRKADGTPVGAGSGSAISSAPQSGTASPAPLAPTSGDSGSGGGSTNNGVVLSAAASLYPEAQQQLAAQQAEKEAPPPKKFKKIKANKELEAGKNKWQDFNNKSKFGKAHKKDSMFRTPEGVRGRVGFTGSGQAMRKDPTRSRHIYQTNDDQD
ncbi:uncharacterized protein E0L32_004453 [Thyridium curvatum]|uniref:DNA repair protein Crb2 Tudor domain-containing protein n=1 Tax=Thyridium curvatum TaxID=1093900 RepID=A0A507B708_9PEZI|nr:uncharacterized protein E0L32_004453 [Thyridium curvatum]TPX15473.1 hypothetical protein E0L32_004453 [Thyridium curvatum]